MQYKNEPHCDSPLQHHWQWHLLPKIFAANFIRWDLDHKRLLCTSAELQKNET